MLGELVNELVHACLCPHTCLLLQAVACWPVGIMAALVLGELCSNVKGEWGKSLWMLLFFHMQKHNFSKFGALNYMYFFRVLHADLLYVFKWRNMGSIWSFELFIYCVFEESNGFLDHFNLVFNLMLILVTFGEYYNTICNSWWRVGWNYSAQEGSCFWLHNRHYY